jgi:hypothetical protein
MSSALAASIRDLTLIQLAVAGVQCSVSPPLAPPTLPFGSHQASNIRSSHCNTQPRTMGSAYPSDLRHMHLRIPEYLYLLVRLMKSEMVPDPTVSLSTFSIFTSQCPLDSLDSKDKVAGSIHDLILSQSSPLPLSNVWFANLLYVHHTLPD